MKILKVYKSFEVLKNEVVLRLVYKNRLLPFIFDQLNMYGLCLGDFFEFFFFNFLVNTFSTLRSS